MGLPSRHIALTSAHREGGCQPHENCTALLSCPLQQMLPPRTVMPNNKREPFTLWPPLCMARCAVHVKKCNMTEPIRGDQHKSSEAVFLWREDYGLRLSHNVGMQVEVALGLNIGVLLLAVGVGPGCLSRDTLLIQRHVKHVAAHTLVRPGWRRCSSRCSSWQRCSGWQGCRCSRFRCSSCWHNRCCRGKRWCRRWRRARGWCC